MRFCDPNQLTMKTLLSCVYFFFCFTFFLSFCCADSLSTASIGRVSAMAEGVKIDFDQNTKVFCGSQQSKNCRSAAHRSRRRDRHDSPAFEPKQKWENRNILDVWNAKEICILHYAWTSTRKVTFLSIQLPAAHCHAFSWSISSSFKIAARCAWESALKCRHLSGVRAARKVWKHDSGRLWVTENCFVHFEKHPMLALTLSSCADNLSS